MGALHVFVDSVGYVTPQLQSNLKALLISFCPTSLSWICCFDLTPFSFLFFSFCVFFPFLPFEPVRKPKEPQIPHAT